MKNSASKWGSVFVEHCKRYCSVAVLTTSVLVFWILRVSYWLSIDEAPFSDMMDYYKISRNVWENFAFGHDPFWQSYKPPGLPILAAPLVGLFPDVVGLWAWRIVETLGVCVAALWLASEIGGATRSKTLGYLFFATVALAKSSIFWSYRFSTESLTECCTYLVLATFLRACRASRRVSPLWSMALGALSIGVALVRPNMVVILGIMPAGLVLWILLQGERRLSAFCAVVCSFGIGVAILWSPWLARGYRLYGAPVPFSTQGPYSFLWELGEFTFTDPQLGPRQVNERALKREAFVRFANDREAAALAQEAGRQWLQSYGVWPFVNLYGRRLASMAIQKEVSLAKTPRHVLFPDAREWLLVDKNLAALVVAGAGMLCAVWMFGSRLLVVVLAALLPNFLSAVFMGLPRMAEPVLPLILFFAVIPVWGVCVLIRGLLPVRARTRG